MSAFGWIGKQCSVLVATVLLSAASAHAQNDGQRVFTQVAPSIVTVLAFDETGKPEGQGSGVIVGPDRIVTNCHVVRDAQSLKVRHAKGETAAAWTLRDPSRDLCTLAVTGLDGPAARLRAYKELAVGERVYAVGNPLGFDLSVSEGLITALVNIRDDPTIITNAALSPGSSGGGLFDAEGRLIGITTSILSIGQNLNLVLAADGITELNRRGVAANPAPPAPAAEPNWKDEAEALREKSDWKALEPYARKWLQAHPTSSQAGYYLGVAVWLQGRFEEAESILRDAVKRDDHDATAWSYLAHILHSANKKEEANQALERAIAIRGNRGYFFQLRAGFMRTEKRFDEAKAAIERAIALEPGVADYWFTLGRIEAERNQLAAAAHAYRVVLRLDAKYAQARQNLAEVLARSGNTNEVRTLLGNTPATGNPSSGAAASTEAATWLAVGNKELQANRLADAESAYRKVIALVPLSPQAWTGLGNVYERSGRLAEAEEAYLTAIKSKADFAFAHWSLGRLQQRRGELHNALTSYKNATDYDPANPAGWMALATLAQGMRDFRQSAAAYQRIVDLGKANAQIYVQLGDSLLRSGHIDRAREAMQNAEKLAPDDSNVLLGLAMVSGTTGDRQRALDYAERAIAKMPTSAAAWSTKGYSLLKLGRVPEAITALETAVGLNPKSINALINLGEAKLRNNENGAAIRILERALDINPNTLDARYFAAQAYFSVKQVAKVREHLQAILALSPDFPQGLALTTLADLVEGKNEDAIAHFNRLKAKDPKLAAEMRRQAITITPAANILPE